MTQQDIFSMFNIVDEVKEARIKKEAVEKARVDAEKREKAEEAEKRKQELQNKVAESRKGTKPSTSTSTKKGTFKIDDAFELNLETIVAYCGEKRNLSEFLTQEKILNHQEALEQLKEIEKAAKSKKKATSTKESNEEEADEEVIGLFQSEESTPSEVVISDEETTPSEVITADEEVTPSEVVTTDEEATPSEVVIVDEVTTNLNNQVDCSEGSIEGVNADNESEPSSTIDEEALSENIKVLKSALITDEVIRKHLEKEYCELVKDLTVITYNKQKNVVIPILQAKKKGLM